jgi:hypothetical protein
MGEILRKKKRKKKRERLGIAVDFVTISNE